MSGGGALGPRREGEPSRDPAASMSLLRAVFNDPLTGVYRRAPRPEPSLPLWRRAVILLVAVALGVGTGIAVRGLTAPGRQIAAVTVGLRQQVRERADRVHGLQADVRDLRAELRRSDAQAAPTASVPPGTRLLASTSPATGAGIAVTLDDAKGAEASDEDASDGLVRDADIRYVLNALWRAGAEAIAVEGVRMGVDVPVRQAGQTILVDLQVAQPPYRIEAIGDPSALAAALAQGETGDYLSTLRSAFGIDVDVRRRGALSLPAETDVSVDRATPERTGAGS